MDRSKTAGMKVEERGLCHLLTPTRLQNYYINTGCGKSRSVIIYQVLKNIGMINKQIHCTWARRFLPLPNRLNRSTSKFFWNAEIPRVKSSLHSRAHVCTQSMHFIVPSIKQTKAT